jgi:hypothetical protein
MICAWSEEQIAPPTNPYADWEIQTRPDYLRAPPGEDFPDENFAPAYRPCFVRLRGESDGEVPGIAADLLNEAEKLFDPATDFLIRLPDVSKRQLQRIAAPGSDVAEHRRRLIVYMLEDLADDTQWFTVLHHGPAVPGLTLFAEQERAGGPGQGDPEPPTTQPDTGTSPAVVTAVIDSGIAIANERFCRLEGERRRTRIWHYWRQTRENVTSQANPGFGIGRSFDRIALNDLLDMANGDEPRFYRLLREGIGGAPAFWAHAWNVEAIRQRHASNSDPFGVVEPTAPEVRAIPYTPQGARPLGLRAGHGTWVLDLAAGAPCHAAPEDRPIVAVDLPDYAVADTAGKRLEMYALMGVMYVLDKVDDWQATGNRVPVVINISLGNSAGPRDGTGFFEEAVARLVDARNAEGVATKVVIAAGNNWRDRMSGFAELAPGKSRSLDWRNPPGDKSPSYLEIRLPKAANLALRVATPDGTEQLVADGKTYSLTCGETMIGRIYNNDEDGANGPCRLVTIALAPTQNLERPDQQAPVGRYRLHVANQGTEAADVRFVVQRDDTPDGWPGYGRQSTLDHPESRSLDPETRDYDLPAGDSLVRRERTLSAHATSPSEHVFVVGGAMALAPGAPGPRPARYTAEGPCDDERVLPDLSAPSEDGPAMPGVLAAGFFSGSVVRYAGTSGAAPQVTRRLAELIAEGFFTYEPKEKPKYKEDAIAAMQPVPPAEVHRLRLGRGSIGRATAPGRVFTPGA